VDLQLAGKVAVVTGASKGIGLAITETLAAEGARVVAGARTTASLEGIDGVTPLAVDLASADGPARLVRAAVDAHGRLDILVNNVGAAKLRLDGFLAVTDADFAATFELNFYAMLRATRAALEAMTGQDGGGRIVNICSVNATFEPDGGVVDYGAAKAAVLNLSKSIAQEFGPQGIRINCISPGPVATDLWLGEGGVAQTAAAATGTDADTARDAVLAGIGGLATGRLTTPGEVAAIAALLASDRAGNVTGSNYVIDGGLLKTT
jgi:NAD(P)-dependent dehydrogenase (short-subunit alcohol dehydrogenase family)